MSGGATKAQGADAGSVDYYRTYAGPPAMLSLGPYPEGTDGMV